MNREKQNHEKHEILFDLVDLVPTLRVGTSRGVHQADAERPVCIPTQSVGTRIFCTPSGMTANNPPIKERDNYAGDERKAFSQGA